MLWPNVVMGYSIFYPYGSMEVKFSRGVPETFSKGVGDLTYLSEGVRASFPEMRGVIPRKLVPYESNLASTSNISRHKREFRILPSIPLYD